MNLGLHPIRLFALGFLASGWGLISCASPRVGLTATPPLVTPTISIVSPTLVSTLTPLAPTGTPLGKTPAPPGQLIVTPPPPIGSTQVSQKDQSIMMAVPAGEFVMGASDSDAEAFNAEKPQHKVRLDFFWIDRTEVTNAQYALCVSAKVCQPPKILRSFLREKYYDNPEFANYPVIHVTWLQAQVYCGWAQKRLPTEAEWEKAARGSEGLLYPWGNEMPNLNFANYDLQIRDTNAVGKYAQGESPYGVWDMAGNVWEWVADWYDAKYYAVTPIENPTGPATGTQRALRGGSWVDGARGIRVTMRSWFMPELSDGNVGFRCVH